MLPVTLHLPVCISARVFHRLWIQLCFGEHIWLEKMGDMTGSFNLLPSSRGFRALCGLTFVFFCSGPHFKRSNKSHHTSKNKGWLQALQRQSPCLPSQQHVQVVLWASHLSPQILTGEMTNWKWNTSRNMRRNVSGCLKSFIWVWGIF